MNPWLLLGYGWAAMAVAMALLWIIAWRTRNASGVDIAWSLGVGALAIVYAVLAPDGDPLRRLIVAAMAWLWALRLGWHIARRLLGGGEDGRYRRLREKWKARANPYFFVFFQLQALWAVVFAVPMLVAARNPAPAPGWLDWLAIAIWLVAMAGEWLADHQLSRFKADPARFGEVCERGLWRYSRHPNYFFEWLHWWAFVCLGILAPYGWITLLGPALMLLFLLKITGVPAAEARSLAHHGAAYRDYQRRTNTFFPGPTDNP
jgi:steroid 5-alpha reductase family enzyme